MDFIEDTRAGLYSRLMEFQSLLHVAHDHCQALCRSLEQSQLTGEPSDEAIRQDQSFRQELADLCQALDQMIRHIHTLRKTFDRPR
ncbi:MAG TPA: hypothetical protein VF184_09845 [Phycisphaeraceae bacterium]